MSRILFSLCLFSLDNLVDLTSLTVLMLTPSCVRALGPPACRPLSLNILWPLRVCVWMMESLISPLLSPMFSCCSSRKPQSFSGLFLPAHPMLRQPHGSPSRTSESSPLRAFIIFSLGSCSVFISSPRLSPCSASQKILTHVPKCDHVAPEGDTISLCPMRPCRIRLLPSHGCFPLAVSGY